MTDLTLERTDTELTGTAGVDVALILAPGYISGRVGEDRVTLDVGTTSWTGMIGSREVRVNTSEAHWAGRIGEAKVAIDVTATSLRGSIGEDEVDVTVAEGHLTGTGPGDLAALVACWAR